MSDLPDGWTCTTIKELAGITGLFVDGDWIESKDQDPNGNIRLLQLADIGDSTFLDKSDRWINEDAFVRLRCTELATGDVLVARMPDPLGRACLMPTLEQRCVTVVDVAALRVDSENIDNRWVMQTINSPQIRAEIAAQSSGTTRRRISRGRLGEMEIPLPPKAEQTRIANQLDALLTRVQACNDRFDAIPALLKRFRQTIYMGAISGTLTEDWRAANNVNDWTHERAADVCAKVQSGGTPKEGFSARGVPFLKVYNIVNQKVAFDYKPQYIESSIHHGSMAKSRTQPGDVLMNIVGPPLGKVAIVPADRNEWNINQAITLFRPSERISTGWLYCILCSGVNIADIIHETRGSAGQVNISLSQCRDFVFPVPTVVEQAEIVRRVEALFALADRIETRCTTARAQAQRLTPLVLAKAFRGELVPQDPNDEPASALLARIASSNTAVAGKNKQKVPVARKERAQAAINL